MTTTTKAVIRAIIGCVLLFTFYLSWQQYYNEAAEFDELKARVYKLEQKSVGWSVSDCAEYASVEGYLPSECDMMQNN